MLTERLEILTLMAFFSPVTGTLVSCVPAPKQPALTWVMVNLPLASMTANACSGGSPLGAASAAGNASVVNNITLNMMETSRVWDGGLLDAKMKFICAAARIATEFLELVTYCQP